MALISPQSCPEQTRQLQYSRSWYYLTASWRSIKAPYDALYLQTPKEALLRWSSPNLPAHFPVCPVASLLSSIPHFHFKVRSRPCCPPLQAPPANLGFH